MRRKLTISDQQGRLRKTLRPARARGFTMIELMVAISIIAILGMLAVPAVNGVMLSSRLTGGANSFLASALLARSEAIKRNAVVRLCRSSSRTSCATSGGWEQGWIVFKDTNGNGAVDNADDLILHSEPALASGYIFTGDSYNLAFQPIGAGATTANLILCRKTPTVGDQERKVTIGPTGRTSVEKSKHGVCT